MRWYHFLVIGKRLVIGQIYSFHRQAVGYCFKTLAKSRGYPNSERFLFGGLVRSIPKFPSMDSPPSSSMLAHGALPVSGGTTVARQAVRRAVSFKLHYAANMACNAFSCFHKELESVGKNRCWRCQKRRWPTNASHRSDRSTVGAPPAPHSFFEALNAAVYLRSREICVLRRCGLLSRSLGTASGDDSHCARRMKNRTRVVCDRFSIALTTAPHRILFYSERMTRLTAMTRSGITSCEIYPP